jgi:hypothetical protein
MGFHAWITQPPHGPVGGVGESVPLRELVTVEVVFENREGLPEGT